MSSGYIYLLQPLRSITDNQKIYKIGKTKRNNFKRFNEYPSGSILLLQSSCNDCDLMEKHLLKLFDGKFIKETNYGREYFQGDLIEMKKLINSEVMNEKNIVNNSIDLSNNIIGLDDVAEDGVVELYGEYRRPEPYDDLDVSRVFNIENNTKKYGEYRCELCNFVTVNKSKYYRHNLTDKHKKNEIIKICKEKDEDNLLLISCEKCNKKYKSRVGLWRHSKTCNQEKLTNENSVKNVLNTDMFMELINQNKQLQKLLVQQSKDNTDLINKLIER